MRRKGGIYRLSCFFRAVTVESFSHHFFFKKTIFQDIFHLLLRKKIMKKQFHPHDIQISVFDISLVATKLKSC